MESETVIDDLFDEVLLQIFSHLNLETLVTSVQHVSIRWTELSQVNQLWKSLEYRPGYDDGDDEISSMFEQAPKLQIVTLDKVVIECGTLKILANSCPNLRKLALGQYQDLSSNALMQIQKKCLHLEHLTIQERILHDIEKATIIGQFKNLKTLVIVEDLDFPTDLVKLRPIAEGCPSLEQIDIRSKIAKIDDLEYLLVMKKDKLQVLGMTCWSEDGFCTLPLLSVCTALNTLRIDNVCQIDLVGGVNSLMNCRTLTRFSWTHLGTTDLNHIMTVFQRRNLGQLVELNISRYANYDDKLADAIVKSCPQLKKLHLPECWSLTDYSLKNLHTLHKLQSVDVCGSEVTNVGIKYLSYCRHLQYLDLSCCKGLTGEGMPLIAKLSDLKVLILDGCDIQGIPFNLIPTQLKSLSRLSICCCYGVDQDAIIKLKVDMPLLKIIE